MKQKFNIEKDRWAIAKKGDPCVLQTYATYEQAQSNITNRKDLEVRKVIG